MTTEQALLEIGFPQDQIDLFVERLPAKQITSAIQEADAELPRAYSKLLRLMGTANGDSIGVARIPVPSRAWLEISRQRGTSKPTFSHPAIAEAVEYMGGWGKVHADMGERTRNQFVMAFKELTEPT